ncbi:uncharacterized protein [Panulirus ornatus]|uniref:uncharacterized protein n=1 Tax=Panulirus ornatus TaxID=150431 RepID=UPI003A8B8AAB
MSLALASATRTSQKEKTALDSPCYRGQAVPWDVRNIVPAVFHNSMLYKKLMENTMNLPDAKPIFSNNTTCLPHVIVGDEAFGIMKHIMRPYSGKHLTYKKKIFNYRLSRARQYIECTFGILANKWRIFHRPLNVEMLFAENIIKACCILHNYVRERDGYKFEDTV